VEIAELIRADVDQFYKELIPFLQQNSWLPLFPGLYVDGEISSAEHGFSFALTLGDRVQTDEASSVSLQTLEGIEIYLTVDGQNGAINSFVKAILAGFIEKRLTELYPFDKASKGQAPLGQTPVQPNVARMPRNAESGNASN
jgi:hypothetical protein